MYAELLLHLTTQGLLSDKPYRFRFSRSTADVSTSITEIVYPALNKNGETWNMNLDISNIFNVVWYADLLQKLVCYGISDEYLAQLFSTNNSKNSFNRNVASFISYYCSRWLQGFNFKPKLFLIFINDLHDIISSYVFMQLTQLFTPILS